MNDYHDNDNTIKERIKALLRRYFEVNDNGDANAEYDEIYSAQDCIDDIHNIVGDI